MKEVCAVCSADSLTEEQVIEHSCGLMDARSAFEDGCPKCNRSTDEETFETVETITRCSECGHWQAPPASPTEGLSRPVNVTFPELPRLGQQLTWLPSRFVPESERRRQFLSSAMVIMVLMAGLTGSIVASPLLESTPAAETVDDTTWKEYDSIVIFRNDDIQPWYETERMRAVDQVFIEEDVPVTLGIIPNAKGDLPLTDDEATCEYLGSLQNDHPGQFEMALHGYTHQPETDFHGGSEFGGLPYDEQSERLADGERILGECAEPSKTFVPPMNTYDEATVRALNEGGYTTVSGGEWFTDEYYDRNGMGNETTYFKAGGVHHVPETQAFEDWDEYNGSGEVPFKDTETLTDEFDETHEENGVHVQMIHYQYFTTEERLEQLRALIQHMKSTGDVKFMTIGQFANGVENGSIERTDDGWRVLEPIEHTSTEEVENESSAADSEEVENEPSAADSEEVENDSIERTDDGWRVLEPIEHTPTEEAPLENDPSATDSEEADR